MTDFDAFAAAYRTAKRQRTFEVREHEAAIPATNPMDSTMLLFENSSRRGHSGVGGELRLDVSGSLNPTEAAVLHAMAEAVKLSQSKTVVRVAGGWVRDKLLGLEVSRTSAPLCNIAGEHVLYPAVAFLCVCTAVSYKYFFIVLHLLHYCYQFALSVLCMDKSVHSCTSSSTARSRLW